MERKKIYERNPSTGVVRWRYEGESHEDYGWPNYGNIEDCLLYTSDAADE